MALKIKRTTLLGTLSALLAAVQFGLIAQESFAARYLLTEIPRPFGVRCTPWDLNDAGTTMLWCAPTEQGTTFIREADGSMHPLAGTAAYEIFNPDAINNAGEMTGFFSDGERMRAFRHSGSALSVVGPWLDSVGRDINNNGLIVGEFTSSTMTPFMSQGENVQALSIPTGAKGARAIAVNDAGDIVGTAFYPSLPLPAGLHVPRRAVLWRKANGYLPITLADAFEAEPLDINGPGEVIGHILHFDADGNYIGNKSFLVDRMGAIKELPTLGGKHASARRLNDSSQAVGYASYPNEDEHAVLWENGSIVDLNSLVDAPDWVLTYATAINNTGQIIGYGSKSGSTDSYNFLLTPITPSLPPGCRTIDIGSEKSQSSLGPDKLTDLSLKALSSLRKAGRGNSEINRKLRASAKRAQAKITSLIQNSTVTLDALPETIVVCADESVCRSVDNSQVLNKYFSSIGQLAGAAKRAVNRASRLVTENLTEAKALTGRFCQKLDDTAAALIRNAKTIPASMNTCGK